MFLFLTTAVFPGESQKRKSDNDDKHGHAQEKRRPSTLVEGKKIDAGFGHNMPVRMLHVYTGHAS